MKHIFYTTAFFVIITCTDFLHAGENEGDLKTTSIELILSERQGKWITFAHKILEMDDHEVLDKLFVEAVAAHQRTSLPKEFSLSREFLAIEHSVLCHKELASATLAMSKELLDDSMIKSKITESAPTLRGMQSRYMNTLGLMDSQLEADSLPWSVSAEKTYDLVKNLSQAQTVMMMVRMQAILDLRITKSTAEEEEARKKAYTKAVFAQSAVFAQVRALPKTPSTNCLVQ